MSSTGVLLVAGYTPRSQAYAQALAAAELMPEQAVLLGEPPSSAGATTGESGRAGELCGLRMADLTIPLRQTLMDASVTVHSLDTRDINAAEVVHLLRQLSPRLIIFSGYGGQIVRPSVLDLGVPVLHVHSGWLPEYRGSTTAYYSLLQERVCAASALLLDPQIDTGPVLARKRYPAPPQGTDIDRLYDAAMRADLLVEVLRQYRESGELTVDFQQRPEVGQTYYIIHPVLKHLALLSLP